MSPQEALQELREMNAQFVHGPGPLALIIAALEPLVVDVSGGESPRENYLDFEAFTDRAKAARTITVKPYGIYFDGTVWWDERLPLPGTEVRVSLDETGPCHSLIVFDIDGNYLTIAWPPHRHEGDHPVLREIQAELAKEGAQP